MAEDRAGEDPAPGADVHKIFPNMGRRAEQWHTQLHAVSNLLPSEIERGMEGKAMKALKIGLEEDALVDFDKIDPREMEGYRVAGQSGMFVQNRTELLSMAPSVGTVKEGDRKSVV